MAIAHVASGTRLKADVSLTGSPQSVALPAGHISGHWLLMVVITEDNTGPSVTPSGWTFLGSFNPGASTNVPYAGHPHVWLYHRIDNGSLGSSVSVSFSTAGWPTGNPYVLAWTEAYSGVDNSAPVEVVSGTSTTSTAAAFAHPQMTTALTDDWLISVRAVGADTAKTFTISGGTNTERVDDSHGSPAAPSGALYDAGPLTTGLQTQRTTTASATVEYGSVGVSIVIRPAASAGATTALAQTAVVTATANDAEAQEAIGPWDLCGPGGLPVYAFAIDWDADGSLVTTGRIMNLNPYFEENVSDWTTINSTITRSLDLITPTIKVVSGAGSSPRADCLHRAAVAGQSYRVTGWLYAPAVLPSTAALWLNWFDGSDVFISLDSSAVTLEAGVWTKIDATFTAPASTAFAGMSMVISGTPGSGVVLYGYGLLLLDPSDTSTLITPGPGENVRPDIIGEVSATYGRDQDRQLNPAAVGSASFSVINVDRTYSPEWLTSPLFGDLEPARAVVAAVSYGGSSYPIFTGRIDDYDLSTDFDNRTVGFTFLDGLSDLSGTSLSTEVYVSMRTGELINVILDLAGWTAARDIDVGATVVPFWWAEETDAFTAINDLIKSEGPPAIGYVAPDGTFIFRDRHHRLLRSQSITSQATFASRRFDCGNVPGTDVYFGPVAVADGDAVTPDYLVADDADAADVALGDTVKIFNSGGSLKEDTIFTVVDKQSAFGFTNIYFTPDAAAVTVTGDEIRTGNFDPPGFDFTPPFSYAHGWRDIVNSVTFNVEERVMSGSFTAVWESDDSITLGIGQSREVEISASDPFMEAQTPVLGTDFTTIGAGTVIVTISRTSGQSLKITFLAAGGSVTVSDLQLRAKAIEVARVVKINQTDTGSVSVHGERTYPETAPWANANDAGAIASMILLRYAQRRPTVQLRAVTEDPTHFLQVLLRTVSDRIRIINAEAGIDSDFFVERVTHTIQRFNQEGQPPVHAVILGCEKELELTANPLRFDVRGAGFDDGIFDPISADNPDTVFIFDDPVRGVFDTGLFGT